MTETERAIATAFAGIPPRVRERIEAMSVRCRFREKETLFRARDVADSLYIVVTGRVRVSRETARHSELLHTESAGGVLGEIPVFGDGVFPATAVATEPTQCLKLSKSSIERLLAEHPEFARFALIRLATRARSLLRRIDELTARTVTSRIAQHFLERAVGRTEFSLGMAQAALAEELGTAREVVVRAIGALVRMGAVRRVGRARFRVADRGILRSIAGE